MVTPFMPDPEKIAAIRELMPATAAGIFLNAGTAGPMPAETQRAMDEQSARELAVGRASMDGFPAVLERMAEARASLAAILVADPDDIALTHSTTDGINAAVNALPWGHGDRVITTVHEHPGGLGAILGLRDRLGIEVELLDIEGGIDEEATVAAFARALERPARAVVLSHVLWTTGAVLPVARIAAHARAVGAVTIVDAAQAAGAIPVSVEDLGVDAYAFPGQKWLLGPEGMGGLWARRSWSTSVTPASTSFLSYAVFDPLAPVLHPNARRFEATNYHRPSVVGLARSCGWLTMYVGLNWALERAGSLARETAARIAGIPGVTMLTPRTHMGTIVTFRIAGWPAATAATELGARSFAIVRDLAQLDAIRVSVGFWNTEEELERFATFVELLAAHAPDTIPPRRTLTVLGSDDTPLR